MTSSNNGNGKPAPDRFCRLPRVQDLTGLGRTSIYAIKDFPKPFKLTARGVAWRESEVVAWMESRQRASASR
jgi:prophage regulatory protein